MIDLSMTEVLLIIIAACLYLGVTTFLIYLGSGRLSAFNYAATHIGLFTGIGAALAVLYWLEDLGIHHWALSTVVGVAGFIGGLLLGGSAVINHIEEDQS